MIKVAVLGGTGMLGSMVLKVLTEQPELSLVATYRKRRTIPTEDVEWRQLDAEPRGLEQIERAVAGTDWIVNAIGLIKQRIKEHSSDSVRSAIEVNARFPHDLARVAEEQGAQVIQIATDCVYSGTNGAYAETAAHDAHDVYGKTKSLGEVTSSAVQNFRCSIIGPETQSPVSLLGWFLGQPPGATITGFRNHHWNGVTTLHFARICAAVISMNSALPSPLHVMPRDSVSKAELLEIFASEFARDDVTIEEKDTTTAIDRRLSTRHPSEVEALWRAVGYERAPTIASMVHDLSTYMRNN